MPERTREVVEAEWNAAIEERDAAIQKAKDLKAELDVHLDTERISAVLSIDASKLSNEERKQLLELIAKAAAEHPGGVVAEANLLTQDTEGGKL